MTFGRLSLHFYARALFEYNVGICGCKILEVPGLCFTWHDRRCVCDECSYYVCKCPSESETEIE